MSSPRVTHRPSDEMGGSALITLMTLVPLPCRDESHPSSISSPRGAAQ
ncbi:hypothetical protein [Streptomyces sp. Agncl-13]